jgi:hypothetical protein
MCTLILGVDVTGPGTVIVGANRDENPSRPSDPPGVLLAHPRVFGGRDRLAGGTWLAVREGRTLVAMLNRRDAGPPPAARRSRGLLALEAAGVRVPGTEYPGRGLSAAALDRVLASLKSDRYAPFSMVFASPAACWMVAHEPGHPPREVAIGAGWHVLTHAELDDPDEPRAARLLREISSWAPQSVDDALSGLAGRLREHGGSGDAVCVHEGPMVTVSSSRVWLAPTAARYLHIEGRPCVNAETDVSSLLVPGPNLSERP